MQTVKELRENLALLAGTAHESKPVKVLLPDGDIGDINIAILLRNGAIVLQAEALVIDKGEK